MHQRFTFLVLSILALSIIVSPAVAQKPTQVEATTNIVVLKFNGTVSEHTSIEGIDGTGMSMHQLLETIYKAKDDAKVHGLELKVQGLGAGRAKLTAIIDALTEFRASGKPIYCYMEGAATGQYLIASQATRLSIYPTGSVFIPGVAMQKIFVKGLLSKIGIEADFITQGKYKSAAEMMTRNSSSAPAREASMAMLDDMYDGLVSVIAKARNLSHKDVEKIIDSGIISSKEAVKLGMIDHAEYQDEYEAAIKAAHKDKIKRITKYNRKKAPNLDPSSFFSMFSFFSQVFNPRKEKESPNPKIAILYASGGISSGKAPPPSLFGGTTEGIYSDDLVKEIRKLRDNDTVKAVVLRIDSPGGSALASDVIYRELELLKAKKPVIASMSDVAASGGYYMAAPCDLIYAEELTITGSIGVLGGKMVMGKMFDKLGIRTEVLGRGKFVELFSTVRKWNAAERELIDSYMGKTYDEFVTVVAKGRKMSAYDVHKVAQGRVWTGKAAKEIGLVDKIGGVIESIEEARTLGKLTGKKDVEIVAYPKPRSFFDLFREGFGIAQVTQGVLAQAVPEDLKPLLKKVEFMKTLTNEHFFYMLPYEIVIE